MTPPSFYRPSATPALLANFRQKSHPIFFLPFHLCAEQFPQGFRRRATSRLRPTFNVDGLADNAFYHGPQKKGKLPQQGASCKMGSAR